MKDVQEAVKWFKHSSRQGNPQGCQNLGICYQAGVGVPKDLPKAEGLFRQAVAAGRLVDDMRRYYSRNSNFGARLVSHSICRMNSIHYGCNFFEPEKYEPRFLKW